MYFEHTCQAPVWVGLLSTVAGSFGLLWPTAYVTGLLPFMTFHLFLGYLSAYFGLQRKSSQLFYYIFRSFIDCIRDARAGGTVFVQRKWRYREHLLPTRS